jgi:hypothetical protein
LFEDGFEVFDDFLTMRIRDSARRNFPSLP